MNKAELIAAVAEKAGLSKKDTEAVINATLNTITAALQDEEKVQLVGFGSFEMKKRDARTGLNTRTKEPVEIAATQVPVFKVIRCRNVSSAVLTGLLSGPSHSGWQKPAPSTCSCGR